MCSQEKWVGQGPPKSPQADGSTGWMAVAVKEMKKTVEADAEYNALTTVQAKLEQTPMPHHVTSLVEAYDSTHPNGTALRIMVTKYVLFVLLSDATFDHVLEIADDAIGRVQCSNIRYT